MKFEKGGNHAISHDNPARIYLFSPQFHRCRSSGPGSSAWIQTCNAKNHMTTSQSRNLSIISKTAITSMLERSLKDFMCTLFLIIIKLYIIKKPYTVLPFRLSMLLLSNY